MASKLYDLAVKTGEYRDSTGATKGRWQNVGAVMKGDDGGQFIMLAAWFNPAGVPRKDGSESVLVSCFEPRQQGDAPAPKAPAQTPRQNQPTSSDDDFPF